MGWDFSGSEPKPRVVCAVAIEPHEASEVSHCLFQSLVARIGDEKVLYEYGYSSGEFSDRIVEWEQARNADSPDAVRSYGMHVRFHAGGEITADWESAYPVLLTPVQTLRTDSEDVEKACWFTGAGYFATTADGPMAAGWPCAMLTPMVWIGHTTITTWRTVSQTLLSSLRLVTLVPLLPDNHWKEGESMEWGEVGAMWSWVFASGGNGIPLRIGLPRLPELPSVPLPDSWQTDHIECSDIADKLHPGFDDAYLNLFAYRDCMRLRGHQNSRVTWEDIREAEAVRSSDQEVE